MKEMLNVIIKTGISVTTIVTIFLFSAGFFYFIGYLEYFNLNPWITNIPFYRIIYPKLTLLIIVSNALLTFLSLHSYEESTSHLKKVRIFQTVFTKSSLHDKILTLIFDKENILKFLPIFRKKSSDLISLHREEINQLNLKQDEISMIYALNEQEYMGFCWFLVYIKHHFFRESNETIFLETYPDIENKYNIGKAELSILIFSSISNVVFFVILIYISISIYDYRYLSATILGTVLGFLIFYGIKFKMLNMKISTLIFSMALILCHCYYTGKIDAAMPLNKIGLILENDPKLNYYDLIIDNKEGVYVIDEVKNGNSIYQRAKFIKNIEIKQLVFPSFKRIEK